MHSVTLHKSLEKKRIGLVGADTVITATLCPFLFKLDSSCCTVSSVMAAQWFGESCSLYIISCHFLCNYFHLVSHLPPPLHPFAPYPGDMVHWVADDAHTADRFVVA